MKKLVCVISLVLAMVLCACACAETIQPAKNVNMENELCDMTVHVGFSTEDVTEQGIYATVYDEVIYDIVDVGQMKVGDKIETSAGTLTVESIENDGNAVLVNGGMEEGGVTLYPEEESNCYYEMAYELPAMVVVGQCQLTFGDTVKINVYKMTEDLSPAGEGYDTVEVAGTEAAAELAKIGEKFYGEFDPSATTVTIGSEEAVINEITINYVP